MKSINYSIFFSFFLTIPFLGIAQVGIGTTSPTAGLEIVTDGSALNALRVSSNQAYNSNPDAGIGFRIKYNTAGAYTSGAVISGVKENGTDGNQSGSLRFWTNNGSAIAEKMRITSGGNVGIGTTSPQSYSNYRILHLAGPATNGSGLLYVTNSDNSIRGLVVAEGNSQRVTFGSQSNHPVTFVTNDQERMQITSGGYLGIGTASPSYKLDINSSDATTVKITSTTSDNNGMLILNANTSSNWSGNWHEFMYFQKEGNSIGGIKGTGSGTSVSYETTSDYRLKDDFQSFSGLGLVSKIKVYDYAWKSDRSRMYGFKAHELQSIVPYLVSGQKDEVDSSGKPKYQMVDYSKLTPILVKAIQEQQAEIDTLKKRLADLEAKLK